MEVSNKKQELLHSVVFLSFFSLSISNFSSSYFQQETFQIKTEAGKKIKTKPSLEGEGQHQKEGIIIYEEDETSLAAVCEIGTKLEK